jgi:hypothetical protein
VNEQGTAKLLLGDQELTQADSRTPYNHLAIGNFVEKLALSIYNSICWPNY